MAASFPHLYTVNMSWQEDAMALSTCNENQTLRVGPPPQFDGPNDLWSPEDMFLAAIQTCLMTTFFSLVRRRPFEVYDYESKIEGDLDKTDEGLLFTGIRVYVSLTTDDPKKAERLMHTAERYCIISNMLTIQPELKLTIQTKEEA